MADALSALGHGAGYAAGDFGAELPSLLFTAAWACAPRALQRADGHVWVTPLHSSPASPAGKCFAQSARSEEEEYLPHSDSTRLIFFLIAIHLLTNANWHLQVLNTYRGQTTSICMYTKIIGYILKGKPPHLSLIYRKFARFPCILKLLDS